MMEKFSLPTWSARNPLGIIALFISLIYAMSAVLLGTSIKNLTETNQTVLVIFIVVFPFVVLTVFGWLVAKHHRKLYGPGDYRSDEGFLNAASASPPSALGERLREEVEQAKKESSKQQTEAKKGTSRSLLDLHADSKLKRDADHREVEPTIEMVEGDPVLRVYAAENLVFQELQNEFGGGLRRHVSFRTPGHRYQLNGVLELKDRAVFVEVKNLFSPESISEVLQNAKRQFLELLETSPPNISLLLALVLNFETTESLRGKIAREAQSDLGKKFEIRIYSFSELSSKYGLAHKPKTRLGSV